MSSQLSAFETEAMATLEALAKENAMLAEDNRRLREMLLFPQAHGILTVIDGGAR